MNTETATNIIDVTEASFQADVLTRSEETTVIVDFWAPWCGPCRMLGPILERLAEEPGSQFVLAKVNADHAPNLSGQYNVRGIPAVKAFRNGRVVDEFVGALPEPQVRQFIQKVAPRGADQPLSQAQALLEKQAWVAAATAYRQLLQEEPNSSESQAGLARALLAQGEGCEASQLLAQLPDSELHGRSSLLQPLATYLCRQEQTQKEQELTLLETRYRQVAHWLKRQNISHALDTLLQVIEENRRYRKGEAHELMLAFFELLGDDDPRTTTYREKLGAALGW